MVRVCVWALAAIVLLVGNPSIAQDVERAPTPSWVQPLADSATPSTPDGAPIRILTQDEQTRFTAEGVDTYTLRRTRIQTTQGLGSLSTISASWAPPSQSVQVHSVRILRGDQVIDALDGQEFQLLRRENNLESSMLDGVLTATLQPRDLRVGDILETAFTIHDDGGVLSPHRELLDGLNVGVVIDHYRARTTWPSSLAMRYRGIGDWASATPRRVGDQWVLEIEERDLQPSRLPDNLPRRYYFNRTVQFTDFRDWAQAADMMVPLYARAEVLEENSPLHAEIARIRAENPTQAGQAAAALRLVQEQIRYVALSMGEGGYVPASADDVWRARYGDCKGKTALLIALLHNLGIEAVPALVSTRLSDGLDERLPLMAWFDHIIVRATVGGRIYWLDGTRVDDRDLSTIQPPTFGWALPVRAGSDLEEIIVPPAETAVTDILVTFDASSGLDAEGRLDMDIAYTGDAATAFRQQVANIPAAQLQTLLLSAFKDNEQIKVGSVDTRYDEGDQTFHLLMTGTTRMAWVSGSGGRVLSLSDTALGMPTQAERTDLFAAWKDAPYTNTYPARSRTRSRIILPHGGEGFRIEGPDQTVEAGGYRLERTARIVDGVADIVVTTTSLTDEVSAADMAAARTRNENLSGTVVRIRAPASYVATDADRSRLDAADSDLDDLIERAKRLTEARDMEGGLALLDAAVELEPDNAKARLARGEARLDNNDFAGAQEDYDHAADLDPADIDAVLGQGAVQLADGRPAEAVVSYSVVLRLDPGNVTGLWGRGAAYYQIGRLDRALVDFRALKTAAPDLPAGPSRELRILLRLDRRDEVRALIAERLEKSATDYLALDAGMRLARLEGDPAAGLPALDAAIAVAPDNVDVLALRGRARAAAGDVTGARADFDRLRAEARGDPILLNNVCWGQALAAFDLDRALADCDAAIAGAAEAGFIDSRAMVLLQMERYAEAKSAYDLALADRPNLIASLYGRGLARIALGDAAGSEDLARAKALSADAPDNFEVFVARHPQFAP
ncbi:DUF3857 domain-containing protein [Brevundimonas sp. NIBR11]|uniref:DUF3857 domain-containing protein n=1 Tax=Brevundimonas sp. NIBR11 TaxID=3015999 RepID=UPI0022F0320B|nr:DUF3857 domain-containing protein [Brevundimonas sp. NIBR11]